MSEEDRWQWGVPQWLLDAARPQSSPRKLRLVAIAYARAAWHLLTDPRSRHAVEVAERYADGEVGEDAREAAHDAAAMVAAAALRHDKAAVATRAVRLAVATLLEDAYAAAYVGTTDVPHLYPSCAGYGSEFLEACRAQTPLLHDIFVNPFRPVEFDPRWRSESAVALARISYDTRDFSLLPILADALQDAGCEDSHVLDHCRGPGTHVRGCWVVDLVLSKE